MCNRKKVKNIEKEEPKCKEVEEIMNSELTDKQRLFCIKYSKYLKYKCSYETAMVEGCESLRNPKINEITTTENYSLRRKINLIGFNLLKNVEIRNEIERLKAGKCLY